MDFSLIQQLPSLVSTHTIAVLAFLSTLSRALHVHSCSQKAMINEFRSADSFGYSKLQRRLDPSIYLMMFVGSFSG
jgi:hypothetical protein